jgi:hypothetical protein
VSRGADFEVRRVAIIVGGSGIGALLALGDPRPRRTCARPVSADTLRGGWSARCNQHQPEGKTGNPHSKRSRNSLAGLHAPLRFWPGWCRAVGCARTRERMPHFPVGCCIPWPARQRGRPVFSAQDAPSVAAMPYLVATPYRSLGGLFVSALAVEHDFIDPPLDLSTFHERISVHGDVGARGEARATRTLAARYWLEC